MSDTRKIVALCGGVGGAKLALGLAQPDEDHDLAIIANTGDDFEHLGLRVSPDIDTITYTLAGIANPDTGWGRDEESWTFMDSLEQLGGPTWFRLGDKDLALNVLRTAMRQQGQSLSEITGDIARRLGVTASIIPMSDTGVRTTFETEQGELAFQDYFVRLQCEPVVSRINFAGASEALPAPAFDRLLADEDVTAFIICPSNPFISIDPILSIPTVRERLAAHPAPVVAMSPVIDGESIKGPTAKLMKELNLGSSSADIANYYGDLIDGFVIDHRDSPLAATIQESGSETLCSDILMSTFEDRCRLARETVSFANRLAQR